MELENPKQEKSSRNIQRYAGIVEYEGTGFGGWQIQPNSDTIQARIEKALIDLFNIPIRIQGSGRTDAGRGDVEYN